MLRRTLRLRDLLFLAYVILCALALTWPLYDWLGNRVEPFVLGVPFTFAWNVGWILLSFFALLLYDLSGERG